MLEVEQRKERGDGAEVRECEIMPRAEVADIPPEMGDSATRRTW